MIVTCLRNFLIYGPILSACIAFPETSQARILEKIYAVVNGETISLSEIKEYQSKLKSGGFLNDLLFSDPKEREKAMKDRDYLIKLLIDEKIIDFAVKQNGLLVTEERVDKEINEIASRQNLSIAQLKMALKDQGVNYVEYRDFVKSSIERRQLVEKEITSKIKISEQDIISHYLSKNQSSSTQIFEFNLAHILFNESDRQTAKSVAKQILSGSSFESMVKKYSVDDDTKASSGKFGTFKSGEMIAAIEKAIASLKIGESTSVVETPMGLHIFKVLDKKLIKDPAIEQQKERIYQQLFANAFKEQLDFWLLQQRKDAIIQINKS